MGAPYHDFPSQYSRFLVWVLKPNVPERAFLGLPFVSHVEIVGSPIIMEIPCPTSIINGDLFAIVLKIIMNLPTTFQLLFETDEFYFT
jgi:hypothetical protein